MGQSTNTCIFFFYKLRIISRLYRQYSKYKAKQLRRVELDTRAKLEINIAKLHEDLYNVDKQGEVNLLQNTLDGIETGKARGATIRARVKWQKVGDKCLADFFKSVRQKHCQTIISVLKDKHGRIFTQKKIMERICHDFYKELYRHKEASEGAIQEVLQGFPAKFTDAMNVTLTREITKKELSSALTSMANGKALCHDGIPIEVFKKLQLTVGNDYHIMILGGIENKAFQEGVTKGLIVLILKERDSHDLNHQLQITLLTSIYKIYAKTLQLRLQPMLSDVISPE